MPVEPIRVFMVEDNEDSGEALCMLLEQRALLVQWVRSGAEARLVYEARRRTDHPGFDVILLDLLLPDSTGVELVEALAAQGPLPPVVLHSAASEFALREAVARITIRHCLRKPCDPGRLIEVLEQAAAEGRAANRRRLTEHPLHTG